MENQLQHNLFKTSAKIRRAEREKMHKQRATLIWFTGLSGAGKTTLSQAVEERLHQLNYSTMILDGDNVRTGLCSDLGFSLNDRSENIRRIAEVGKLFVEAGVLTLAAFISPQQKDRELVHKILGTADYLEVFCKCPLAVCEARDVKGIYKRARAGEIKNFTGIDSIYEEPNNPDLVIESDLESLEDSVERVLNLLRVKKIIQT